MMTKNHTYFEKIISEIENAELGNMFGKPCGKINKKAFVSFFEDEMVFKIGREEISLLLEKYEGSKNWDPSGKNRAMKDWIQMPGEYRSDWKALGKKAIEFMES